MDNSAKEKEALALAREADGKMKKSVSLFGTFVGSSSKAEEACDMYTRAANIYKMIKSWRSAGDMFLTAARVHLKLKNKHKAVTHYETAGDYYKGEESTSSANKCFLKVAMYAAQLEQYEKAIQLYETIGTYCMDQTLLRYSAKDHFFNAALCHFCVDMLNAKLAVQRYQGMFPAFSDSRECKLMKKLLDTYEEQDAAAYTAAVKEFDSITRLDQWHTAMLHRVKEGLQMDENSLR